MRSRQSANYEPLSSFLRFLRVLGGSWIVGPNAILSAKLINSLLNSKLSPRCHCPLSESFPHLKIVEHLTYLSRCELLLLLFPFIEGFTDIFL